MLTNKKEKKEEEEGKGKELRSGLIVTKFARFFLAGHSFSQSIVCFFFFELGNGFKVTTKMASFQTEDDFVIIYLPGLTSGQAAAAAAAASGANIREESFIQPKSGS